MGKRDELPPPRETVFGTSQRTDGDPAWDRAWSSLAPGDNIGPAVFVTARAELAIEAAGVEFIAENGDGAGVKEGDVTRATSPA